MKSFEWGVNGGGLPKSFWISTCVVLLVLAFTLMVVPPFAVAERNNEPAMIPTDGTLKREVVYAKLDALGQVDQLYVVNHFQPLEKKTLTDYGNYEKVIQLTGETPPVQDGKKITIENAEGHYYYQGNLVSKELPWSFIISYRLDGDMQIPKDLSGATGKLKIELAIRRNNDVQGGFFDHFALQVTVPVDPACSRILSASKGFMVTYAGSAQQLTTIILPGEETTLEVELDVKDFRMGQITLAGVPLSLNIDLDKIEDEFAPLDDLSEGIAQFAEGSARLRSGYGDLMKAFDTLRGGSWKLVNGGKQLASGVNQLKDGVNSYASGVSKYVDGAKQASSGYAQLDKGLSDMHAGVKTLSSEGKTLLSASSSIRDGLVELASKLPSAEELAGKLPSFSEADLAKLDQLVAGSEQFRDGLHEIAKSDGGMYKLWQGLVKMHQLLVTEKRAADLIPKPEIENWQDYLSTLGVTVVGTPEQVSKYYELMAKVLSGYASSYALLQATLTGLLNEEMGVPALENGAQQIFAGLQQLDAAYRGTDAGGVHNPGIHDAIVAIRDQLRELAGSGSSVEEALNQYRQLVAGVNALRNGYAGVYDANGNPVPNACGQPQVGFHKGLSMYLTDGVGGLLTGFEGSSGKPGLLDGSASIRQGLDTLASQGNALKSAGTSLSKGASATGNGISSYVTGVNRLQSGLSTYRNKGMTPYGEGVDAFDQGAQKLKEETKDLREKFVKAIKEKIEELSGDGYEVKSFTSEENVHVASVQFVIMTDEIPPAETPTQPSAPDAAETEKP